MDSLLDFLRNLWKGLKGFFTVGIKVDSLSQRLEKVETEMKEEHAKTRIVSEQLSQRLDTFSNDMLKVKEGLQIELFGTLRDLHDKLVNQKFATYEQKVEARQIYDQIHNLGQDGWSQKYYDEIMAMPESREEYWASLNNGK